MIEFTEFTGIHRLKGKFFAAGKRSILINADHVVHVEPFKHDDLEFALLVTTKSYHYLDHSMQDVYASLEYERNHRGK